MLVGALVKHYIGPVFEYCDIVAHDEIGLLMDARFSKETFGLNFSFCKLATDIDDSEHKRYWTRVYVVRGKAVRVTSQWFDKNRAPFGAYLVARGAATEDEVREFEESPADREKAVAVISSRVNARYRGNAIGNAQNLVVRNILSNLGSESFSEKDWRLTQEYFGHRCAYCGAEEKLVIEHAIPINRQALGEHRLGNIVPACDACNKTKGDKDFREFLEGNDQAIAHIATYMDSRNYVPLEDNDQMRMILNTAHAEVASLATRYISIINSLFAHSLEVVE